MLLGHNTPNHSRACVFVATVAFMVLSVAFGASLSDANAAERVKTLQRELLLLLQGKIVPVNASPAACQGDGIPTDNYVHDPVNWYFGQNACTLTYPPSLTSIITTPAEGHFEHIVDSPSSIGRLYMLLNELRKVVTEKKITLQHKLQIQTTAWEIMYGIKLFGESSPKEAEQLAAVLKESFLLMKACAFTEKEVGHLPTTLANLPKLANTPEIGAAVQRLLSNDPAFTEVLTTDLHADMLFGRFTPRLFLTAMEESERPRRLRGYLLNKQTRYVDLQNLPHVFSGVQAILILYFNVLTDDFTILPTKQVAYWHQYTFSGKTSFDFSYEEMAKRIEFLTIGYERNLENSDHIPNNINPDGIDFTYSKADQNSLARRSVLEVKPVKPDYRVTTLRGQCLRCHLNRVATFDTVAKREVKYSVPLVVQGRAVLTRYYLQNIEPTLKQWAQSALSSNRRNSKEGEQLRGAATKP